MLPPSACWIPSTSHDFTGLTPGQIYYYAVQARDAAGNETAFSPHVFSTQGNPGEIRWTGGGNGQSWSDPDNWDLGIVPDASHEVFITMDGTYTVQLGASATMRALTVGGSMAAADRIVGYDGRRVPFASYSPPAN